MGWLNPLVTKLGPKAAKFAGPAIGAGFGAITGAGSGFIEELTDDDGFDAKDIGMDALYGAGLGMLGGGAGALLGKVPKVGKALKFGSNALGQLSAAGTPWNDRMLMEPSEAAGGSGLVPSYGTAPQGMLAGLTSLGGRSTGDPLGIGAPPGQPTMTMSDYMQNARLNGLVDDAISREVDPIRRSIKDTRDDMAVDLATNESLGSNLNDQIGQIARDNKNNTNAIQNNAAANSERAQQDATDALVDSEAMLNNNNYSSEQLAEEHAANQERISERRMSDAELLRRLGVTGQNAIGEIQSAEAQQTGQNSVAITNAANKAVRDSRGQIKDVMSQRKGMLNDLAMQHVQMAQDKHQMGLQTWQAKLQAAVARSDAYQSEMKTQASMLPEQPKPMTPAQMSEARGRGGGMKIINPGNGQAVEVPQWVGDEAFAQQIGVPQEQWNMWQGLLSNEDVQRQLGMG